MGISKYENAAAVDDALDKGVEAWNRAVINNASDIIYDNSASGLEAENVQSAIDEIKDEFHTEIEHVSTWVEGCVKAPNDEIARIGDSIYVAEVDENGKPTKWEYGIGNQPIDPSDLTYDQIAKIVRSGRAEEVFKIGDHIMTTYTDTNGNQYEMPWDVVAFRDVELENHLIVPGMVIQSHYATVESIQFDASEPSSSDQYVRSYGWNRWSYSAVRQWLNSSANAGSWWTSTHTEDVAPKEHGTYNGFMKGLPVDFLNMLKKTKHETALNYVLPSGTATKYTYDITYDTFFLPSLKEEHFQYSSQPTYWDGSDREGSTWEYWIQRKGETAQNYGSSYANTNAIRYSLADRSTAISVRLRSADRHVAHYSNIVSNTGVFANTNCGNSCPTTPVAIIC